MSTDPMWCFENYGEAAEHIDELEAEIERLSECLCKANEQTENFERLWSLTCDDLEEMTADRDELRAKLAELQAQEPVGHVSLGSQSGVVF